MFLICLEHTYVYQINKEIIELEKYLHTDIF